MWRKMNCCFFTLSTVLKQNRRNNHAAQTLKTEYTSLGHSKVCLISSSKITKQNRASIWKIAKHSGWPNIFILTVNFHINFPLMLMLLILVFLFIKQVKVFPWELIIYENVTIRFEKCHFCPDILPIYCSTFSCRFYISPCQDFHILLGHDSTFNKVMIQHFTSSQFNNLWGHSSIFC